MCGKTPQGILHDFWIGFSTNGAMMSFIVEQKNKPNLFSGSSIALHTEARILLLAIILSTGQHQLTVKALDLWAQMEKHLPRGGEECVGSVASHK